MSTAASQFVLAVAVGVPLYLAARAIANSVADQVARAASDELEAWDRWVAGDSK